jgi:hypothetical protein
VAKNNCLTREEAFIKILKEIAKLYSPPQTTDTKILEIDVEIQQTVANINNIADENDDEYDDEDNENGDDDDEEEEIVESEQLHFCLNDMNTEVASNSSEVAGNSSEVASNYSEVASNSSEVASNSSEVASNSEMKE